MERSASDPEDLDLPVQVCLITVGAKLYSRGPQPPGRDPLPGRGRIPTVSRESSGENVYRYDVLLFIVHK